MEPMEDYERILKIVRRWPEDRRLSLLREIKRTLPGVGTPLRPPRDTLSKALGLVRTDKGPPPEEDTKRMLDEHSGEQKRF